MDIFPELVQYKIASYLVDYYGCGVDGIAKKDYIPLTIKLYTDPTYTNKVFGGLYWPGKVLVNDSYKAAHCGNIRLLQAMHANNEPFSDKTFSAAVMYGSLEVIKWLYENNYLWDEDTFSHAAS